MSREPGREGTEASEAWREAGRDMLLRVGAASVVVRRFRAAEGQPRLDAVLPVSQSKLGRRCVSSMSDMLGSSH